MSQTRICLVRHGETPWNAERRLQGHENIPLNATGRQQAEAAAQALRQWQFDAIVSSDLDRAHETASIIASRQSAAVRFDPRLRERHFGLMQGLTRDEAEQRHPGLYALLRNLEPDSVPAGGGESLLVFHARVREALETLARMHVGQTLLVVSHGGCLDAIYRMVTGIPLSKPRDFPLGNATLNWIEHEAGRWQLLSWDERSHLRGSRDEITL
ncbi:MAG: histidine phosphatase family protein [Candidatus Dactylopiibacterium carminicum]|nr:histidine phosphatase family protein [Candidatus Dactylopiibacterium carminicum]PAS99181.1 MAG: histidine phosphatase family protein [Candidatus Dactylopiibacterium carminicum]